MLEEIYAKVSRCDFVLAAVSISINQSINQSIDQSIRNLLKNFVLFFFGLSTIFCIKSIIGGSEADYSIEGECLAHFFSGISFDWNAFGVENGQGLLLTLMDIPNRWLPGAIIWIGEAVTKLLRGFYLIRKAKAAQHGQELFFVSSHFICTTLPFFWTGFVAVTVHLWIPPFAVPDAQK